MPKIDLTSDAGLREAAERCLSNDLRTEVRQTWIRRLAQTFEWVQAASEPERAARDFQQRLWEDNHFAAAGQGKISLDAALDDEGFRSWVAQQSMRPLPSAEGDRVQFLSDFNKQLIERLDPFCSRTPRLKVFRVLAALYPGAMTTVSDRKALRTLYSAMGGPRTGQAVRRHVWILERLQSVLGPPGESHADVAERVALPWALYATFARDVDDDDTTTPTDEPGELKLVPMPASRRRRGLTGMGGGFPAILSALDFIQDGVTRDELLDFLRSQYPESKQSTLGVYLNVLQSEFAVTRRDGDRYVLTERGHSVLESQDPDDLSDWLLTHILGVDHVLVMLRDEGPLPSVDLRERLRRVNPGWTTGYAPGAMMSWLKSFGVIRTSDDAIVMLTDVGVDWAARIHWAPEPLPEEEPLDDPVVDTPETADHGVELPDFAIVAASVSQAGHFDASLVARLHAGLWANTRRHFAVLTGLSGSGKTLLARAYAKALSESPDDARLLTLPVQPGWYDPGALLGYVNPLRGESYVSTPFLEFLLRATRDPQLPHIVVLDEMNLSHPEQYMAPLLSAMETGGRVELHAEGEHFDGVPSGLPYPPNLVLIGTVNMDEATHGLSDKVLDRAFVLEFWDIDLSRYPRWGTRELEAAEESRVRSVLEELISALEPARLHFGWRTVDDVLDFIATAKAHGGPLPFDQALDGVIGAKVVPKLRGDDSPRIREAMDDCRQLLKRHGLRDSASKVDDLRRDLESTGSARFWR